MIIKEEVEERDERVKYWLKRINPCGGAKRSTKEFIEVETDSPAAYVKENGQFPIMESLVDTAGRYRYCNRRWKWFSKIYIYRVSNKRTVLS